LDVCGDLALAVAQQAIEDGVARYNDGEQLQTRIAEYRWLPEYPEIIAADS